MADAAIVSRFPSVNIGHLVSGKATGAIAPGGTTVVANNDTAR